MEVDITVPLSSLSFGDGFIKDGNAHTVANTSGGIPPAAPGNVWCIEQGPQTPTQIPGTLLVTPLLPLKVIIA